MFYPYYYCITQQPQSVGLKPYDSVLRVLTSARRRLCPEQIQLGPL